MRIIEHGLVGKYVQCPTCKTIFEFEHSDELQEDRGPRSSYRLTTKFYILCQECKNSIVVLERKLIHGPSPGYWHTEVKQLNFVSHETGQESFVPRQQGNDMNTFEQKGGTQ